MKRNTELIRSILLAIEEHDPVSLKNLSKFADADVFILEGHVRLLYEDGMIERDSGLRYRLKNKGHDFLDNARSEEVWKKATDQVKETVGSVSLTVLNNLLASIATKIALGQ